jgi:hypothetical protein
MHFRLICLYIFYEKNDITILFRFLYIQINNLSGKMTLSKPKDFWIGGFDINNSILSSPSVSASCRTSGASKNRDWPNENGSDFPHGRIVLLWYLLVSMVFLTCFGGFFDNCFFLLSIASFRIGVPSIMLFH